MRPQSAGGGQVLRTNYFNFMTNAVNVAAAQIEQKPIDQANSIEWGPMGSLTKLWFFPRQKYTGIS